MANSSVLRVMNRLFARNAKLVNQITIKQSVATQAKEKLTSNPGSRPQVNWDLYAAVCLERKPVVTRSLSELEKNFSEMLATMEVEASLMSDHERRHLMDLKRAERLKKGSTNEADLEQAALQTAQDFEDASTDELNKFKPASRLTKADEVNDQKSLDRLLDRHLLLVVSQTVGKSQRWVLPQVQWTEGETLRQTAERALTGVSSSYKARFLGNAPSGVYKIKYPASLRKGEGSPVGAKIFFFKAHLLEPKFTAGEGKEFLWLGRTELQKFLQPEYLHSVEQFLIDED